jgi:alpha-mannosidase
MIRDGVSMMVHGESCAHFMRTVNKEKSMRTLKDTGAGKRISSVDLVAMALLLFAVCVLGGAQAGAQSADQAAQIVKSLSSHTHDVVARLTELDRLPADEWRFHAGDLAHGESPDLDDSSWQVVKAQAETSQEAEWFRRWIEVPQTLHGYDLTGARIWFSFAAYANGPMPEIIYFNGRRVALAMTLSRLCFLTKSSPETRCWSPSNYCTR